MVLLVERSSAAHASSSSRDHPHNHEIPPAALFGRCGWMVESCSYAVRIKYRTLHRTSVRRACAVAPSLGHACSSPRSEDLVLRRAHATNDGMPRASLVRFVCALCWWIQGNLQGGMRRSGDSIGRSKSPHHLQCRVDIRKHASGFRLLRCEAAAGCSTHQLCLRSSTRR